MQRPVPPDRSNAIAPAIVIAVACLSVGALAGFGLGRPIDDNGKDVLVAGIGGLLGLVTGVSVALVGFRNSRASDRERYAREDRHRFTADKQAAYAHLLRAGDQARAAIYSAGQDATDENLERASERTNEMTAAQDVTALLAPDRVDAAVDDYVEAMVDFHNQATEIGALPLRQRAAATGDKAWDTGHARVLDAREAVLKAMRADLELVRARAFRSPRRADPGAPGGTRRA